MIGIENYASLRSTTSRSISRDKPDIIPTMKKRNKSRSNSKMKLHSFAMNNNGLVNADKKYCIFTTKEKSNVVVATDYPIPGKLINEQLSDI